MKRIESIEIENVKGIKKRKFDLNIIPNKPSLLVAPNGFGKTWEIQGHHTYSESFFLRPAFRRLTVRIRESSSESRKESLPKARPVRSCRRILSASSSSASERNDSQSPTISSSGETLTRTSSLPSACALALLHFQEYGSAERFARTGFISMYLTAENR